MPVYGARFRGARPWSGRAIGPGNFHCPPTPTEISSKSELRRLESPRGQVGPPPASLSAPADRERRRGILIRLHLAQHSPRPEEEQGEDGIADGEELPDVGDSLSEPVADHDPAVRHLEEDAVGNEVAVAPGSGGHREEHQGEDDEQGAGELDVTEVTRRGDAEIVEDGGRRDQECRPSQFLAILSWEAGREAVQ